MPPFETTANDRHGKVHTPMLRRGCGLSQAPGAASMRSLRRNTDTEYRNALGYPAKWRIREDLASSRNLTTASHEVFRSRSEDQLHVHYPVTFALLVTVVGALLLHFCLLAL